MFQFVRKFSKETLINFSVFCVGLLLCIFSAVILNNSYHTGKIRNCIVLEKLGLSPREACIVVKVDDGRVTDVIISPLKYWKTEINSKMQFKLSEREIEKQPVNSYALFASFVGAFMLVISIIFMLAPPSYY